MEAFFIYRNMTSQVLSKHEYKANLGVIDKKVEVIKAMERAPSSVSGIVDVSTLDSPLKPINNVFLGNGRCVGVGIDQGFHNWLLHSRQLYRALGVGGAGVGGSVTVFAQGEGPVNTIGELCVVIHMYVGSHIRGDFGLTYIDISSYPYIISAYDMLPREFPRQTRHV